MNFIQNMFLSKEFRLLEVENPVFYDKKIRYNSHLSRWIIVDAEIKKKKLGEIVNVIIV